MDFDVGVRNFDPVQADDLEIPTSRFESSSIVILWLCWHESKRCGAASMAVPSLGSLINPHETFQEISDLKVQTAKKGKAPQLGCFTLCFMKKHSVSRKELVEMCRL